ncbi:plasmid replication protein RepC [Rhizobium sp. LCM 4573]|uniref:plasmid replication protein RepC n=1 Tax=Rhizobium sp. LCM 4573 TaxID=1848291 RepID=UPI0008D9B9AE|nr:plasmid replication protein RepC [Rhizobium sp. LCM 4573]OHV79460.1 replication initiation protein RepC [Rhizobium sp. LCM 4573]
MESGTVTTPFGRRPISLAFLASQIQAGDIEPGFRRNKWKLFRAVCEARPSLGVTDRALTVLDALLSFYPDEELSTERGLVVFPSNAQLSLRARGMASATLRRHLAILVGAGLIIRKDSPNGKRYARRDRAGEIDEAYGFSLAPLLSRAGEIENLAAQAVADRQMLRTAKERLTICRRDLTKLITGALNEGLAGDWLSLSRELNSLIERFPRVAKLDALTPILAQMEELRDRVLKLLNEQLKTEKMSGNESQSERHKQDSESYFPSESEPVRNMDRPPSTRELRASSPEEPDVANDTSLDDERPSSGKVQDFKFSLETVNRACAEIQAYGPGGEIRNWRDLVAAAAVVRSTLAVSTSAYEEASSIMGAQATAIVMACILERGECIGSAGGYLRHLTRRAAKGEFAVGPMLMALLRRQAPAKVLS